MRAAAGARLRRGSRRELNRKRLQLVDEQRLRGDWGAVKLDLGVALERLFDQDPQFQPRERGAETEVAAAGSKRFVLLVSVNVEAVWVLVSPLRAVCRTAPD